MNIYVTGLAAGLLSALCGCSAVLGLLLDPSETVQVSLVNQSDFTVDARIFYADQQELPEDLLDSLGEELNFQIPAGESRSFTRDCDELQVIVIDDADLQIIGSVGPEATSPVLRDGDDFGCGDEIVFTFDHSAVIADFDVTVDVLEASR